MRKYVLSATDGYGIDTTVYDTLEAARNAMSKAYQESYPIGNDESSAEMSFISDRNAILYRNGEDVLVWDITEVRDERADNLIRNLVELLRVSRDELYDKKFADYLIRESGITVSEIVSLGIMDTDIPASEEN